MATKTKQKSVKTQSSKSGKGVIASSKKFSFSRKQWGIVAVIIVAVAGVGTYLGIQMYQDTTTGAASCVSKTYNKGDSGTCVKYIQVLANFKFKGDDPKHSQLSVDGQFGSGTKSAIQSFQKAWGLSTDGVVGKKTWSALCSTGAGYMDDNGTFHSVITKGFPLSTAKAAGCKYQ